MPPCPGGTADRIAPSTEHTGSRDSNHTAGSRFGRWGSSSDRRSRDLTIRLEEIRAKLEAARTAIASRLHALADEIEALPLEDAAEAFSWLGDQIEGLLREADRILRAQSGRRQT